MTSSIKHFFEIHVHVYGIVKVIWLGPDQVSSTNLLTMTFIWEADQQNSLKEAITFELDQVKIFSLGHI